MQLTSPDGRTLGSTLFKGRTSRWVVIAGATAVHHRYYGALAEALSERCGVNVLTFDYRGVGDSLQGPLAREGARYADWARDLGAAIHYATERGPTVVVGHSFGGHGFGMSGLANRTEGLYTFATGAGWNGWMPMAERIRVWALWNLAGPVLVRGYGYLPFELLNMGENLPRGIYEDWKRWSSFPEYFFDDPLNPYPQRFKEVKVPVVGVNSIDDDWATPASAKAFLKHYPTHRLVTVRPSDVGRDQIGHMAYVRPSCSALWEPLFGWVDERLNQSQVRSTA